MLVTVPMAADDVDLDDVPADFNFFDYILGEQTGLKLSDLGLDTVELCDPGLFEWLASTDSECVNDVTAPPPAPPMPPRVEATPRMEALPSSRMIPASQMIAAAQIPMVTKSMSKLSLENGENAAKNGILKSHSIPLREIHLQEHQDFSTCTMCGRNGFSSIEELGFHYYNIHGTIPDADLPACTTKIDIKMEEKRKCPHCDKSFKNKRDELSHKSKLQESVPCLVCPRSFRCMGPWTTHFHKEHLAGITNFKCQVCSLTLSSRSNLSNHYKTHLKCLLYQCVICGHNYRTTKGMYNHLASHEDSMIENALHKLLLKGL